MTKPYETAETDIAGVFRRLARLEAERDILRTIHQYGVCLDYGLEAEWVDCFTGDGAFELARPYSGKPSSRYMGSAELAAFAAQHTRAPMKYHKHFVSGTRIDLDADTTTATATSYFARADVSADGAPYTLAFGRYIDRLQCGPDGKWRFEERISEIESFKEQ